VFLIPAFAALLVAVRLLIRHHFCIFLLIGEIVELNQKVEPPELDSESVAPGDARAKFYSDSLVIEGCSSLQQFLLACQPGSEEALPEALRKDDALVIRGFDNLLHYLDWFDDVSARNRKE
jgi:hypothetical protein